MNKPVITKIEFSQKILDEIDKIKKGEPVQSVRTKVSKDGIKTDIITHTRFTYMTSKKRLFSLYGGLCCICGTWPDYKVLYDVQGAKRVERYCQKDLDKLREKVWGKPKQQEQAEEQR
jgi:hypothetical protein